MTTNECLVCIIIAGIGISFFTNEILKMNSNVYICNSDTTREVYLRDKIKVLKNNRSIRPGTQGHVYSARGSKYNIQVNNIGLRHLYSQEFCLLEEF